MERTRNWMAVLVSLLIVGGTAPALAGLDLLYTTGEPMPVLDSGTGAETNLGFISGWFDESLPGRYSATAFTIDEDVVIEEVVAYWFDASDNAALTDFATLEWTFHADDVGGGPGTIVATGTLAETDILNEEWIEPVGGAATDWKRRFMLHAELSAGTYWVSFHGVEGSLAWLTGAIDGSDEIYRATVGNDYTLYTTENWETPDDPGRLYHLAFELWGSTGGAPCEGDANGDGVVDPLDSGFVLARFGCPVGTGDEGCDTADQNGDGVVDPLDVGFVLARFGPCQAAATQPESDVSFDTALPTRNTGSGSNAIE